MRGSEGLTAHLRQRLGTETLQIQTFHSRKSNSDFLAQTLKVRRDYVLLEPLLPYPSGTPIQNQKNEMVF